MKLASELSELFTGHTIFDGPTNGLHVEDIGNRTACATPSGPASPAGRR